MPLWTQGCNLAIQLHADPAAHTDHHRLSIHGRKAILKVIDEVTRDQLDSILRSHHRFKLRPLRLELFLPLDLFPFSRLFKIGVDLRPLGRLQLQRGKPALVVDGNCGFIHDRPLDVVDTDVVAEDGSCIGIGLFDGCAGESDERGVRQRVTHMAGEAVDEVILAPVGFVRDHDNVAAF